eukprot:GHVP01027477.1.p1 GENE.GHVP01027477.1~~GHVP01027477.1.p1  ORF type:complete len:148 (-),score=12.28 GHVP01027477.1:17-460(-)
MVPKPQKLIKTGRVCVVLRGRFAGKKAVVINPSDSGAKLQFPFALCAGIAKAPKKVTRGMSKKHFEKRTQVKAFCKCFNVSHLMPTQYSLSDTLDVKSLVPARPDDQNVKDYKKLLTKNLSEFFREKFIASEGQTQDLTFFRRRLRF